MRRWRWLVVLLAASGVAFAGDPAATSRFTLTGTATRKGGATTQRDATHELRATLASAPTASTTPALQSGGRFVLGATLAASSLVCYADTVFRDDFDADGF